MHGKNEDGCETCQEHSGMEARQKTLIWLLGILITLLISIGGTQTLLLMGVKSDLAGFSYRFIALDESGKALKDKVATIEERLTRLETARR